ncbi:MAG: shikimate kinase [Myxococcota bacterium]|jgi:shikimate kinase|nr:shikimate kinase [Myxococcota bacterium]
MTQQTVWLMGMMGAGKSVVGKALAAELALPFVDVDSEIEKRAGARIPQIFAEQGEPAFRELEAEVIHEIADVPQIVSLGGGAASQPGMMDYLEDNGTTVYLRARIATLLARIGDARTRPLLRGMSRAERRARLEELMRERAPHYERAKIVVDTDTQATAKVAKQIAGALRQQAPAPHSN